MMMVNFGITLFHGSLILRTSPHVAMLLSFLVDLLQQETLRYKAELMPLSASRMSEEVTFSTCDVDVCRWLVPVSADLVTVDLAAGTQEWISLFVCVILLGKAYRCRGCSLSCVRDFSFRCKKIFRYSPHIDGQMLMVRPTKLGSHTHTKKPTKVLPGQFKIHHCQSCWSLG